MEFLDLKTQQKRIRKPLEKRINKILDHGAYIMGPEVFELEEKLADYCGVKHAISCSSGTDALLIPLMAWGIGPGDAVFTTPFTYVATAEVISILGATPVFVDVYESTYNIDCNKLEIEINKVIKEGKLKPKAIIPVDLFGLPARYRLIDKIAKKYNLKVIEDAAQSFGATYHGKKSCALARIGSTSFFPSKPLGGFGDGGALFTDDDALADTFRKIRVHGQAGKHQHPIIGLNGRLDTLQAAMLLVAFEHFPKEVALRQAKADTYCQLLSESSISDLQLPNIASGSTSVYAQYTILSPRREIIKSRLEKEGIPSVSYYARPLHLQPVFKNLKYKKGDFPVSELVSDQCLSLPMSPYLALEDIRKIVKTIEE